jgi:hypothetical protein
VYGLLDQPSGCLFGFEIDCVVSENWMFELSVDFERFGVRINVP